MKQGFVGVMAGTAALAGAVFAGSGAVDASASDPPAGSAVGACATYSLAPDTFPFDLCDAGRSIAAIQWQLNAWGLDVTIDGLYGPSTEAAVREFQSLVNRPTVDGVVGQGTWAALFASLTGGTDVDGSGSIEPWEFDVFDAGGGEAIAPEEGEGDAVEGDMANLIGRSVSDSDEAVVLDGHFFGYWVDEIWTVDGTHSGWLINRQDPEDQGVLLVDADGLVLDAVAIGGGTVVGQECWTADVDPNPSLFVVNPHETDTDDAVWTGADVAYSLDASTGTINPVDDLVTCSSGDG